MRTHLRSTTARLGASIIAALGLAPLTACDSDVQQADTSGGGGSGAGGPGTTTSAHTTTSSSGSTSDSSSDSSSSSSTSTGPEVPDHPPTCDELSTSASTTTGAGTTQAVGVGGGGVGGSGTGGADDLYARPCDNPEDVLVGCLDTGVDRCENGFLARHEAVACPAWHRPASEYTCSDGSLDGSAECAVDADCGAGKFCEGYFIGPPAGGGCRCADVCETDADCGSDQLCLCGEAGGRCVTASCRTDADCGPGLLCASMDTGGCDPTTEFHCQSDQDACINAAECPQDGIGDSGCVVDASGARICETGHGCAAVGRPLVVAGEIRFAPAIARGDWSCPVAPRAADEAVRAEVSARWAHVAAMEHASVASFARFALDLLALGAPPELVAGASAAMQDEIEHARLAYGIAAAFGGAPVGPGELDVSGANGAWDVVELAVATFVEGCIAEGAAAAEAAIAATATRDPAIAAVLERIAREEATHAELAWKTIAWALERDAARVGPALRRALDGALAHRAAPVVEPGLEAFGIVGPTEQRAIREETLRTVVAPVLQLLLARSEARAARAVG